MYDFTELSDDEIIEKRKQIMLQMMNQIPGSTIHSQMQSMIESLDFEWRERMFTSRVDAENTVIDIGEVFDPDERKPKKDDKK